MAADVGLLGGLGEGLKQGVQSYQTERDYQLKKQQIAQQMALQKQQSTLANIDAYTKAREYGQDYGNQVKGLIFGNQGYLSSGPSSDQSSSSGDQNNSSQAPQANAVSQLGNGVNFVPAAARRFEAEQNVKSGETGRQLKYNPQTMGYDVSEAPLNPKAVAQLTKDQAQAKNDALRPELETAHDYNNEQITKDTKEAAFNYSKMVEAAKSNSPTAQKGLAYNYIRLENPGAIAREGSLEDLRDMPGIYNKYRTLIDTGIKGTMPDNQVNDLLRSGSHVYQATRMQQQKVQGKYSDLAKIRNVNPAFLKEPELDEADQKSQETLKRLGPYVPPTEQPGLMGKALGGIYGLLSPSSATASSKPKSVIQNGHTYTLNPQTGQYE